MWTALPSDDHVLQGASTWAVSSKCPQLTLEADACANLEAGILGAWLTVRADLTLFLESSSANVTGIAEITSS